MAAFLPIAGAALGGAGLAGSLFGKKKKPNLNIAAIQQTAQRGAEQQRGLIGAQESQLRPLTEQFKTGREQLSASIQPEFAKVGEQLRSGLAGIGDIEAQASEQALDLQQRRAARDIPLQQQLLREQLAASGGLRTGGAARVLQQPVVQQQQAQSDLAAQLASERLSREASRQETGAMQQAELARQGLVQRLGVDEGTLNMLLELGRTDIIDRIGALRGVSQDETNAMLGALGLQAQQSAAEAAAENQRRQALFSGLTQLGGTLLGAGLKPAPRT